MIFSSVTETVQAIKGWPCEINTAAGAADTALHASAVEIMNGPPQHGAGCVREVAIQMRASLIFVRQTRRSGVYVCGQCAWRWCSGRIINYCVHSKVLLRLRTDDYTTNDWVARASHVDN